jgi:hypothetical protein
MEYHFSRAGQGSELGFSEDELIDHKDRDE